MKTDYKALLVGRLLCSLSLLGIVKCLVYFFSEAQIWRIYDSIFDIVIYGYLAFPFLYLKWNPKVYGKNPKVLYYVTAGLLGLVGVTVLFAIPPILNSFAGVLYNNGSFLDWVNLLEIKEPWYILLASAVIYPTAFFLVIQRDVKKFYFSKFEKQELRINRYELIQRQAGYEIGLSLENEKIEMFFKTPDSESTRNIYYNDLKNTKSVFTQKDDWFRNVGYIWVVIGLYYEIIPMVVGQTYHTPLWATLGVICLVIYYVRQVNFTVLETTGDSNILIIQNDQHDKIIEKIYAKRKSYWREHYGKVNPENSIESELNKFEILKEEGIIDEDEFQGFKKQIQEHQK